MVVNALNLRVLLVQCVQKHHAQVGLSVKKVDILDAWQEGRPAGKAQATLMVNHGASHVDTIFNIVTGSRHGTETQSQDTHDACVHR
jgi:hypothetical protein